MLWGDRNSGGWDEGVEPITIPTEEAEVGWGVLMVQIYIGSLHKFFGSNFSWQLNNLGSLIPDCLWEVKLCLCGDIIYFNYYKLQKLWVPSKMQGHSQTLPRIKEQVSPAAGYAANYHHFCHVCLVSLYKKPKQVGGFLNNYIVRTHSTGR